MMKNIKLRKPPVCRVYFISSGDSVDDVSVLKATADENARALWLRGVCIGLLVRTT